MSGWFDSQEYDFMSPPLVNFGLYILQLVAIRSGAFTVMVFFSVYCGQPSYPFVADFSSLPSNLLFIVHLSTCLEHRMCIIFQLMSPHGALQMAAELISLFMYFLCYFVSMPHQAVFCGVLCSCTIVFYVGFCVSTLSIRLVVMVVRRCGKNTNGIQPLPWLTLHCSYECGGLRTQMYRILPVHETTSFNKISKQ